MNKHPIPELVKAGFQLSSEPGGHNYYHNRMPNMRIRFYGKWVYLQIKRYAWRTAERKSLRAMKEFLKKFTYTQNPA